MKKKKAVSTVYATVAGILVNTFLALFKLTLWILTGSGAMLSDSLHSVADIFSDVIVLIGVKTAAKSADDRHPYGHARYESITALMLSVILFATGLFIGKNGVMSIISGGYASLARPSLIAVLAAAVPVIIKEQTYRFMRLAAVRNGSDALLAEAKHHRSDALSCIGGLIGMLGVYCGAPVLDPIAAIVICLLIIVTAVRIFCDSVHKLVDESCDAATRMRICRIILSQTGVSSISRLRTRRMGQRICIEAEVAVPGAMTVSQAHAISDRVSGAVASSLEGVQQCTVCVVPE